MGFQLQAGEPLADGIRRIALGRIDKALSQLTNPGFNRDLAVHEARKTCKRLRAVLRLIRDEVRTSYYRQENVRFRDASRLLAPARDSAVMVETLDALVTRFEDTETIKTNAAIDPFSAIDFLPLPVEPIADLREKLVERHHTLSRRVLETDAVPNFITSLREGRLNVVDWPIRRDSFAALSGGLHRVYRRCCLRMAEARQNNTPETLHDWRKRVKYLWYQLEVIQPIWPVMLAELAEALHTLSSYLGDDHDLAELQHLIHSKPGLLPDEEKRQQLFSMIAYRRLEYQTLAWTLGQRLYAEQPKTFVNRQQVYWQTWRTETPVRPQLHPLPEKMKPLIHEDLLTTRQAAAALAMTPAKIRSLIRIGRLPAFKFGRNWMVIPQGYSSGEKVQVTSTRQAAAQLGLKTENVRKLIYAGHLPASKIGFNWAIDANVLRTYQST